MTLPPPRLIVRQAQLDDALAQLLAEPVVAVDTESDSMYVYHEKVCLLQFSTAGVDYVVDPLCELDLAPLGQMFADPRIEKVFHAAEYDVLCLKRDYGFEFANIFDTMWAARVLGWPRIGLAAILEEQYGVKLDKRWQRHNWGQRPLERAALAYARLDTHYLLDVRAAQLAALRASGREREAREIFELVAGVQPSPRAFDPEDFWRVKGVQDLTGREQAIVRELCIYRDGQARRRNQPAYRVLSDYTLTALARLRPRKLEDLHGVEGMSQAQINRYGPGILEAVARGLQASVPRQPFAPRPDERILICYEALRAWRNDLARRRGVEPDVVMSNATLMSLAQRRPSTPRDLEGIEGLGPYRREVYGEQLLRVVRET